MQHALFLLADERTLFDALPDGLKEGWTVEEETGTAYESDDILQMRQAMLRADSNPALLPLFEKLQNGAKLDQLQEGDIPEDQFPDLFFAMGARGVSVLMQIAFTSVRTAEDVEGLAALSTIRHDLLEANASVR